MLARRDRMGVCFLCALGATVIYLIITASSPVKFSVTFSEEYAETWKRKGKPPLSPLRDHVTLVTAFLDIGDFGKGSASSLRHHTIYKRWSSAYFRVLSPVVLYTDSQDFARHFLSVRRKLLNVTKVILVRRDRLWSFRLQKRIAAVYATPRYPRHYPNTVYPAYTCLTHAKMDFLLDTVENNYFPSRLLAWMDVGYLRNIAGKKLTAYYTLLPPLDPQFNASRVLCGQVAKPKFSLPWQRIIRRNLNWAAGGFFLATRDVMGHFVTQYRRAVTSFLERNESQVEQQVIYAMYTDDGRRIVRPTVELQAVPGSWFSIGFKCLRPSSPNSSVLLT